MTQTTIREIPEKGMTITADHLGICYVNGHMASRPIIPEDHKESAFIWAPRALGYDRRVKLLLSASQLAAVNANTTKKST